MLNHVAILKPPLPQLNVELVSWYITKSCFGVIYNIELDGRGGGGEGETKFVLSMFNNLVILAGMVSRVLSKIVVKNPTHISSVPTPGINNERSLIELVFYRL